MLALKNSFSLEICDCIEATAINIKNVLKKIELSVNVSVNQLIVLEA